MTIYGFPSPLLPSSYFLSSFLIKNTTKTFLEKIFLKKSYVSIEEFSVSTLRPVNVDQTHTSSLAMDAICPFGVNSVISPGPTHKNLNVLQGGGGAYL